MNYQEMKKRVDKLCERFSFSKLYSRCPRLQIFADKFNDVVLQHKYARLMRLHSLTGFFLLVIPVLWSVMLASKSFCSAFYYSLIAFLGALIMRSAGCVINDIIDYEYDSKVQRTALRPIASGEVTKKEAYIIVSVLLSLALLILFTLPVYSMKWISFMMISIIIYPFLKRYTYYAQVFLGLVFNAGILVMWFAITQHSAIIAFLLYAAAALWTIAYDTIYAYQDIDDDRKLGLKSMAMKFGSDSNQFLWKVYQLSIVLISIVGLAKYLNILFFIGMALIAYWIYPKVRFLNLDNRDECGEFFKLNVRYGLLIACTLLVGLI